MSALFLFISLFYITICGLLPHKVSSTSVDTKVSNSVDDEPIPTLYMSDHCRAVLWNYIIDSNYNFLETEAYLMPHPLKDIEASSSYVRQEVCVATFAAPPKFQLLLHLLDVAIDYRPEYKSRLYVFDGFNAEQRLSPYNGLFGETRDPQRTYSNVKTMEYLSQKQALTLMFSGYLSSRFYGFKAVLTPVKRPNKNGTCPYGMFHCSSNWYCISRDLVCNGIQNCGPRDNSDEQDSICTVTTPAENTNLDDMGLMIGCGLSLLILLLAVIWVAVMCQKRYKLRRQRLQLREVAESSWQRSLEEDCNYAGVIPNARWLPAMFQNHLPPWVLKEPPPAYSESVPSDEASPPYDLPPPYNEEIPESRSLIRGSERTEAVDLDGMTVIANRLTPSAPDQCPSYEKIYEPTRLPVRSVSPKPTETQPVSPQTADMVQTDSDKPDMEHIDQERSHGQNIHQTSDNKHENNELPISELSVPESCVA